MIRLAFVLFSVIATTLAGIAVIVVLASGYDTLTPIIYAAVVGAVVAVPATWVLAKKLAALR